MSFSLVVYMYVVGFLGSWITFARDMAFSPSPSRSRPGDEDFDYDWGGSIMLAFIPALLFPFVIFGFLGYKAVHNIPWECWPIKTSVERKGLQRIREMEHQKRLDDTGMEK